MRTYLARRRIQPVRSNWEEYCMSPLGRPRPLEYEFQELVVVAIQYSRKRLEEEYPLAAEYALDRLKECLRSQGVTTMVHFDCGTPDPLDHSVIYTAAGYRLERTIGWDSEGRPCEGWPALTLAEHIHVKKGT